MSNAVTTPCHAAPRVVWQWVQRIAKWLRAEQDHSLTLDLGQGVIVTVQLADEARHAECRDFLAGHLAASTLPPARTQAAQRQRAAFVLAPPLGAQIPARN